MKKLSFTWLLAVLFFTGQTQFIASPPFVRNSNTYVKPTRSYIAPSILMKFHEDYPNATNERWLRIENGLLVSFYSGEIQFRVTMNRMGKRTSEIRYYAEKYLASEIRKLVKESYPSVTIFLVREIRISNTCVFLVTIDTGTEWKVLRIAGAEMDVLESFTKS